MITLLNATNRPNNRTAAVSHTYKQLLSKLEIPYQYLSLQDIKGEWLIAQSVGNKVSELETLINTYINEAQKLIIISPEYNGSFPGILKLFIDCLPHKALEHKKIALTGVATGRGGNLRGMDHLTGILHYLNAEVLPFKLPISRIAPMISESGITDESVVQDIEKQLLWFNRF